MKMNKTALEFLETTYMLTCIAMPVLLLCLTIIGLAIHRKLDKILKTQQHIEQIETLRAEKEFNVTH